MFRIPFISLMSMMCAALAASPDITICKFKDNKAAAVSLTFDDGLLDQYTVSAPLLDEYGMKATFFVVPSGADKALELREDPSKSQKMDWGQIKELAENGHEIGNHSFGHKRLPGQSDEFLTQQIDEPITIIEDKTGYTPVSFAFPWNAWDDKSMDRVMAHHVNARTRQFGIGKHFKVQQAQNWIQKIINKKEWGIAMLHAVISKYHGYDALPNEEKDFIGLLDALKAQEDELWIAPFGEVSKYEKLRDSSTVEWLDDGKSFVLKTDLDTTVYDVPLTVQVSQGGTTRLVSVLPNTPTTL